MRKNILLTGIIFLITNAVFAQLIDKGLIIDATSANNGTMSQSPFYGIKFGGTGSGEGITSAYSGSGGSNIHGIDFSTNFIYRLRVLNNGNVGIGPYNTPSAKLSFGTYSTSDAPLRVAVFDNTTYRFGLGYFEVASPSTKIFSFYVSDPTKSRFGFFDNYTSAGENGYEFVTFNAANRNVGICNTQPASKLHVQLGNIQITNSGAPTIPRTTKTGLTLGSEGTSTLASTDYSWIQSSSGPLLLNPLSDNTFTTQTNNYVAIGLTKAAIVGTVANGYNLLVGGKILCEELKIKLNSGASWYDYVLKPDYKLMSLDSLELFINQNSHLPDIPSEAEVKENGIMTGEMNGLLLKKVEELTLYMIEQNKNTTAQAEQIELLKKQNKLLMEHVQQMVQNNQPK